MLNGTTYIVRPRMQPANSPRSLPRISAGSIQLLVGPASVFALRADVRAVLDPGDVGRIGRGPVAARPLLGVELDEGAGVDELAAELLELGVGAVEPVDGVRLAELHHRLDPVEEAPVLGRGVQSDGHESRLPGAGKRGQSLPTPVRVPVTGRRPEGTRHLESGAT